MKISGSTNTGGIRATAKSAGVSGATPQPTDGHAEPVADRISFAGIPQAELTPRVREALTTLMNELMQLRRDFENARVRIEELEQLADSDPLLGIMNRRAFTRELARSIAMIDRYDSSASLLFIDVNDLKKINDTFGHAAGDAALEHVAAVLAANIRQTDVVGRLGGDEFGVILTQTPLEIAQQKAQVLAELIASGNAPWREGELNVHIAWGAVELQRGDAVTHALSLADAEMYARKQPPR